MLGPLPWTYDPRNPVGRPLHDDWPWPFSLIPRRWTGLGLPMPPRQIAGNAPLFTQSVQPGYPLAPLPHGSLGLAPPGAPFFPQPVPPVGCWTLQAVWVGFWLPCFFAFSARVAGRRLHFNGPLKPDVTTGDWYWWFECSLSWTKIP